MHDGFWYLISDGFTDNVEVGGDEPANKLGFQGFPFRKLRVALCWGWRLRMCC